MKFSMENQTLVTLGERSATESDDLGALVGRLFEAAEPLEGTFNGSAKASFNKFKSSADDIAHALNTALAGIVTSIGEQNLAFQTASEEGASTHQGSESAADFSGQEFLTRIAPQS